MSLADYNVTSVPVLGFKTGLFMQFINGKEWAFVFAIMWLALEGFGGGWTGILGITAITTSGGLLAMIAWTFVGGNWLSMLAMNVRGDSIQDTRLPTVLTRNCYGNSWCIITWLGQPKIE